MLENKKKQDEVLDDMFGYGISKKKEVKKSEALDGLQALRDSSECSEKSNEQNSPIEGTEDQEIDVEKQEAHLRRQ